MHHPTIPLSAWQTVWRDGICPSLSTPGLLALASALASDSTALMQGATVDPPPIEPFAAHPVERACPVGIALLAEGHTLVGQLEVRFAEVCLEAGERLGDPHACRYLLTFLDETPRPAMRTALYQEVAFELARRGSLPREAA